MTSTLTASGTRPAAVAGRFYPEDPGRLESMVRGFVPAAAGVRATRSPTPPKALIGPHAGFIYSGPVAGSAYASVQPQRGTIGRVVLIGPAHYVPFVGIALSSAVAFETPLGDVMLDRISTAQLTRLPHVHTYDQAHAPEHSLEVHLPFIKHVLGDVRVLPMLVGRCEAETVAAALERVWGGPETLIVVSSDLSHYHDYASAQRIDRATARLITAGQYESLRCDLACGYLAIQGLGRVAKSKNIPAKLLDLRNSGDTAGPREEVVGYGAFTF